MIFLLIVLMIIYNVLIIIIILETCKCLFVKICSVNHIFLFYYLF